MGSPPESDGAALCGFERVHRIAHSYLGALWIAVDKRAGNAERLALLRSVQLPDGSSPDARKAIARAAAAARSLCHVNILSVLDVLETGAEISIAYEYVEAEPLSSLQASARGRGLAFPIGVSLCIGIDLLMGLRNLHQEHADASTSSPFGGLSPDSVLVSRQGETKLCDALVASCASLLEGIGSSGSKLGYVAPEQIHPIVPLTASCDVFTVGAVLWELLTGRRLLAGARPVIERRLLEHDLPSLAGAVCGGEAVSPALAGLIDAALAADPGKRPASPLAMAEQLRHCGHAVASRAEVARLVGELSGPRFERHTSSRPSSSATKPAAPAPRRESSEKILIGATPPAPPTPPTPRGLRALRVPMPERPGSRPRLPRSPSSAALQPPATGEAAPAPRPAQLAAAPMPAPRPAARAQAAAAWQSSPRPARARLPEQAQPSPAPEPARATPGASPAGPARPARELTVPVATRGEPSKPAPPERARTSAGPPGATKTSSALLDSAPSVPASTGSPAALSRTMLGVGLPATQEPQPVRAASAPRQSATSIPDLPPPGRVAAPQRRAEPPEAGAAPPAPPPEPALEQPALEQPASSERHAFSLPPAPDERTASEATWPAPVSAAPPARDNKRGSPTASLRRKVALGLLGVGLSVGAAFAGNVALAPPSPGATAAPGAGAPLDLAAATRADHQSAALPEPAAGSRVTSQQQPAGPPADGLARSGSLPVPGVASADPAQSGQAEARAAEPAAESGAAQAATDALGQDFHEAKLDDRQLLLAFSLEQRQDLTACSERLGERAARKYTGKQPRQSRVRLKAARRALQRGRLEAALTDLCAATAHDPQNLDAQRGLAELALDLGDPARAKEAAERGLARAPKDAGLLGILGDAVALLGDLPGSRRIWLTTSNAKGSEAQRRQRLAANYRKAGERALSGSSFSRARSYLRRALILTQGNYGASLGFGDALLWLDQTNAGLAWAERAASALPKSARAKLLLGDAYAKQGELDRARAAWREALRAEPRNKLAARRLRRGPR